MLILCLPSFWSVQFPELVLTFSILTRRVCDLVRSLLTNICCCLAFNCHLSHVVYHTCLITRDFSCLFLMTTDFECPVIGSVYLWRKQVESFGPLLNWVMWSLRSLIVKGLTLCIPDTIPLAGMWFTCVSFRPLVRFHLLQMCGGIQVFLPGPVQLAFCVLLLRFMLLLVFVAVVCLFAFIIL